jgi:hypothetical protein
MLKRIRLPVEAHGAWWSISPLTGSLLRHELAPKTTPVASLPSAVIDALSRCHNPFTCAPGSAPAHRIPNRQSIATLVRLHNRLLAIGNRNFFVSLAYASFAKPLFEQTSEAFAAIAQLPRQKTERTNLCLQRSLLAVKTSRSFRKQGVLFIGAHLESFDMHAWIIEGGSQPDDEDREWINYRPLLALVSD